VTGFQAQAVEFSGVFTVAGDAGQVFELFSPLGERAWVPGWDPELLHPPGVEWAAGQVFRTREEKGPAIWIVTALDRPARRVEYHRVEPGRYVVRVSVTCVPAQGGATTVSTTYGFVGLSDDGNREIAAMTREAYAEKMQRWERWIEAHVSRG
jgi:hypothetical protein